MFAEGKARPINRNAKWIGDVRKGGHGEGACQARGLGGEGREHAPSSLHGRSGRGKKELDMRRMSLYIDMALSLAIARSEMGVRRAERGRGGSGRTRGVLKVIAGARRDVAPTAFLQSAPFAVVCLPSHHDHVCDASVIEVFRGIPSSQVPAATDTKVPEYSGDRLQVTDPDGHPASYNAAKNLPASLGFT